MRAALDDLMDAAPKRYDSRAPHPLLERIEQAVCDCGWIAEARLRLREEGHVFAGELLVVPEDGAIDVDRLEQLRRDLHELDWKLHDLVVAPVPSFEDEPPGGRTITPAAGARSGSRSGRRDPARA